MLNDEVDLSKAGQGEKSKCRYWFSRKSDTAARKTQTLTAKSGVPCQKTGKKRHGTQGTQCKRNKKRHPDVGWVGFIVSTYL